jgi:hypothetical protein
MLSFKCSYNFLLRILVVFISTGLFNRCGKAKTKLDSKLIYSRLEVSADSNLEFTYFPDSINFSYQADTIKQNIPLTFTEFNKLITKKFDSLDKVNTNSKTIKFLKAFYLAEACFVIHSGSFLGEKHGLFKKSEIKRAWSQYNLKQQYEFANSNEIPLQCGEISSFYRKLLKRKINIDSRDTSITGVHTYPVVLIEDDEYIMDPYDPTLIISALDSNRILPFDAIKKNPELAIPVRVNNAFGEKHFLLSNALLDNLHAEDSNINRAIVAFLNKLKENIRQNTNVIYHLDKNWLIRPVSAGCCRFAFNRVYKPDYSSSCANKNFIRLYFGAPLLKN